MKAFARDLFWLLVSLGLWAASFHPLDLWPLAWIAMVPAFVRTAAPDAAERRLGLVWIVGQYFLHGALMGWAGVIAVPLTFLVPLLGIPFSWLTGFLLQRGVVALRLPLMLVAPATIVLVEVLRDQALLGLTWASIGYSQWRVLDLAQLASLGRVHLVSLVVLLVNAGLATAILRWRAQREDVRKSDRAADWTAGPRPAAEKRELLTGVEKAATISSQPQAPRGAWLRPVLLSLGVALAAGFLGHFIRPRDFEPGPLAVGLQPNIPQNQRARVRATDSLRIHHDLLEGWRRDHPGLRPDLLVYSETSFPATTEPGHTLDDALARGRLDANIGGPGKEFAIRELVLQGKDEVTILGLVRAKTVTAGERGGTRDDDDDGYDETNVAWVLRGGAPTDVCYVKRGLAPFGEYTPVPKGFPGRDLIRQLMRRALGRIPGLNPGDAPALFEAPSPSGPQKGSLTICFEMVFPWYFREVTRVGADFHVNISNDAWFDGSSELALVDVAGIFRAIESGRSLFRVSNSGISTLIGPDGARLGVVESSGSRRTQVRGHFGGQIPIWRGVTGYVRSGDWPWVAPAAALLLGLFIATIRKKRFLPRG